jgi:hypothetical protein
MTLRIRSETPADVRPISKLLRRVFLRHEPGDGSEARSVAVLRAPHWSCSRRVPRAFFLARVLRGPQPCGWVTYHAAFAGGSG